jgi:hypothetical protein
MVRNDDLWVLLYDIVQIQFKPRAKLNMGYLPQEPSKDKTLFGFKYGATKPKPERWVTNNDNIYDDNYSLYLRKHFDKKKYFIDDESLTKDVFEKSTVILTLKKRDQLVMIYFESDEDALEWIDFIKKNHTKRFTP